MNTPLLATSAFLLLAASLAVQAQPGTPPQPAAAPQPAVAPQPATAPQPASPAQPAEGRNYTLGPFDSIDITGSAVIRFVQGSNEQVFVEGNENVQRAVALEVERGALSLRPEGSWKFWNNRRLQITVTARNLRRVSISGAADLTASGPVQVGQLVVEISGAGTARFDQLKADLLAFHVSGAGDGRVAGAVKTLDVGISGKSRFSGENLMSDRARVSISGIGNVEVWALQDLSVSVAGVGTVDYWGNPNITRSVSGRATVNGHGPKATAP